MPVKRQLVTAEEFWEMPDVPGKIFELVDGEVVEVSGANDLHHHIMVVLFKLLDRHVEQHDLGLVRPDGLPYIIRRNPDVVRIPDVSFVDWDRVPEGEAPEFFWNGPPSLAVEIVSPSDRTNEIHAKAQGYLEAGTHQVWVLWPRQRSMTIYDADGNVWDLGPDAQLEGGDVLPGFSVRVGDLFDVRRRR